MATKNSLFQNRVTKTPSGKQMLLYSLLKIFALVISAFILSTIHYSEITVEGAGEVGVLILLPVISGALSAAGILPSFDLWLWYLVAFTWIGTTLMYILFIAYAVGKLPSDVILERNVKSIVFLVYEAVLVAITAVIGYANGYDIVEYTGLFLLMANPFTLPVAILTDLTAFTHDSPVWVVIVLSWAFLIGVLGRAFAND